MSRVSIRDPGKQGWLSRNSLQGKLVLESKGVCLDNFLQIEGVFKGQFDGYLLWRTRLLTVGVGRSG
jgi:hypothetical protein